MQKNERGYAWHFSFRLTMSQHQNVGHIMNNTCFEFPAAKIISYAIIAAEDADLKIKVIGLIAGDQMRGTAPQRYLSHKDIRDLRLTRIIQELQCDFTVQVRPLLRLPLTPSASVHTTPA